MLDPEKVNARRIAKNNTPFDERDREFFSILQSYNDEELMLDRYVALFGPKGGDRSGDITPAYSTLEDEAIAGIARDLPQVKIVLLIRDPVERFVSQLSHMVRLGVSSRKFRNWTGVAKVLHSSVAERRSFPTVIMERWGKHFPEARFETFFFDDIVNAPARLRADIVRFVALDADENAAVAPDFNRKASQPKLELPPDVKERIAEHFRAELLKCAKVFGGPAVEWPRRYGFA
jgi:hypothetical protein